jgi:hypothetical protein
MIEVQASHEGVEFKLDGPSFFHRLIGLPVEAMDGVKPTDVKALFIILAIAVLKVRGERILPLFPLATANYRDSLNVINALGSNMALYNKLFKEILLSQTRTNAKLFIDDFRKAWKAKRAMHDTESFPAELSKLFVPLSTVLSKYESENAYNDVQKGIGVLKNNELSREFASATAENLGDPNDMESTLKGYVKQLTGKAGLSVPDAVLKEKMVKQEDLVKKYKNTKALLKTALGAHIRDIVGDTGKEHAPIKFVSSQLASRGLPNYFHPGLHKTDKVHVDLDGQFTDARGQKLSVQDPYDHNNKVVINDRYDPSNKGGHGTHYVFKVMSPDGSRRIGTPSMPLSFSAANKEATFNAVSDVGKNIAAIKVKWRKNLSRGNIESSERVFPNFAELLYWTAMRGGATKNGVTIDKKTGKAIPTYGAANFRVKHVKVLTNEVVINYPGKDNHPQKFTLSSANAVDGDATDKTSMNELVKFIGLKVKGKGPNDIVMTVDGEYMNIDPFNSWLNTITGHSEFKSHAFRKLLGSQIAEPALEAAIKKVQALKKKSGGKELPQKDVQDVFLEACLEVGMKLGHVRGDNPTASTAITSYIDPSLMLNFWKEVGYRPPNNVLAAAKKANM